MYNETDAKTAMGTPAASSYANLVGYLEETKLYLIILPNHFPQHFCNLIENRNKRCMDHGFTPLHRDVNVKILKDCLNLMHASVQYTIEKSSTIEN